jgi:DNA-directed RNA polymerase specialized sigma24 family protein
MPIRLSEEERAFYNQLQKILVQQEKVIFRAKILGLRQREIAFILGISQQRVSQVLKKVRNLTSKTAQKANPYIEGLRDETL